MQNCKQIRSILILSWTIWKLNLDNKNLSFLYFFADKAFQLGARLIILFQFITCLMTEIHSDGYGSYVIYGLLTNTPPKLYQNKGVLDIWLRSTLAICILFIGCSQRIIHFEKRRFSRKRNWWSNLPVVHLSQNDTEHVR